MMPTKIPPYYENFDNSHCAQCSLRGIIECFEGNIGWDWEDYDRFTDKEPDKWTWQYRGQINMARRRYDVVAINSEDVDTFLRDGVYETFVRDLGREAADEIRLFSNLDAATEDMLEFKEMVKQGMLRHERRIPTLHDMRQLLQQGYLLDCSLNSRRLRGEAGYSSHMVLVYGMDEEQVYFHDSSIEHGAAERKTPVAQFVTACTYPTPAQWAITGYKWNK